MIIAKKRATGTVRVAIVQPHMHGYRVPFYLRLLRSESPQYEVWFGASGMDNSLRLTGIDAFPEDLRAYLHPIRNFYLGQRLRWQTGITGLALGNRADVIIFSGMADTISTWFASAVARIRGKRVIFWTHGFRHDHRGVREWLRERFYRLAHGMLHYGFGSRRIAIRRGFRAEDQYVCMNSLDYGTHQAIRQHLSAGEIQSTRLKLTGNVNTPLLIWVGRLTRSKKLHQLLDAARVLKNRGKPVFVHVVGDGPERSFLQRRAEGLGLTKNTRFCGACYDEEEVARYLAASDICVGPGEIGLACIHSMTFGTPVITHDNPAEQGPEYEAIIPGRTGALFHQDDINDLASVIAGWLQHADREAARNNCLAIVERYYTGDYQIGVFNAAVLREPQEHGPECVTLDGAEPQPKVSLKCH